METLEELKEEFNKLDKERSILFKKIRELEDQETLKKMLLLVMVIVQIQLL